MVISESETEAALHEAQRELQQARLLTVGAQAEFDSAIARALGQGLSAAHVARVLGVTAPAIAKALERAGGAASPDQLLLPQRPVGSSWALSFGRGRVGEHLAWDTRANQHATLRGPVNSGRTSLAAVITVDAERKGWTTHLVGAELSALRGTPAAAAGPDWSRWSPEQLVEHTASAVDPAFAAGVAAWGRGGSDAKRVLLVVDDLDNLERRMMSIPAGAVTSAKITWLMSASAAGGPVHVLTTSHRTSPTRDDPAPLSITLRTGRGQLEAGTAYYLPAEHSAHAVAVDQEKTADES